jgi:hypothetical protein
MVGATFADGILSVIPGAMVGDQLKTAKPHKSRDAYLIILVMLTSITVVASVGNVVGFW